MRRSTLEQPKAEQGRGADSNPPRYGVGTTVDALLEWAKANTRYWIVEVPTNSRVAAGRYLIAELCGYCEVQLLVDEALSCAAR